MLELETTTPQATAVPTTTVAEKTTTAAAAAKKAEVRGHDISENLCEVFESVFRIPFHWIRKFYQELQVNSR